MATTTRKAKTKTAVKTKPLAKKVGTTRKKVTKKTTTNKEVAFKVSYEGLASKIFSQIVNKGKYPRGVHATLTAAKKDIVKRIKADTAKAVARVQGLKNIKTAPTVAKTLKTKKTK